MPGIPLAEGRDLGDLPEGYYLDNFETVCRLVGQRDADLLTDRERDWLARFEALPLGPRRLYVRLASRKGPLFRVDQLDYPEIAELDVAVATLVAEGFVDGDPSVTVAAAARLLTKAELVARLGGPTEAGLRRADLLATLEARWPGDVAERLGLPLIHLDDRAWLGRLCLLFFGNPEQGLHEFILSDLGLQTHEPYPIPPGARLFASAEEVGRAEAMFAVEANLLAGRVPADELESAIRILARAFASVALEHRRQGIVNAVARELERAERWSDALAAYASVQRTPSRERRARILARLGRNAAAIRLCEAILDDPLDELERTFADAFLRRLRRRPRRPSMIVERPRSVEPGPERIEQRVLASFERAGWVGAHVENALVTGVFGLVAWDCVFAPAPAESGVFVHPFQAGPLDLFTPHFRARTRVAVDRAIAGFDPAEVLGRARAKRGTVCALVRWHTLPDELLELALDVIPRDHWRLLLRRLARDLRTNRSGLPDLALFDRAGRRYRLVEVKGPGDRLSPNQRRWIEFFDRNGIPCDVVRAG